MLSLLQVPKYHYEQQHKQSAVMRTATLCQTTGSWHRSTSKSNPVFQGSPSFCQRCLVVILLKPYIHHLCLCQGSICQPLLSRHNYAGTCVLHLYVAFINEWVDIRRPGRSKGSCLSNLGERAQVHRRDACSHLSDTSARSNFCIEIFHFYGLCAT